MTWSTPPGPYTTNEIYPSADTNTNQSNFEVLEAAIGLFGAAGARYAVGSLPSAGMKVQWLVQTQGYNNFSAGATTFNGVSCTNLTFPTVFPTGGGVAYIILQMRTGTSSPGVLTFSPSNQAFILDDSISLSGFSVIVYNVNTNTLVTSGSFTCSYMAIGWQP